MKEIAVYEAKTRLSELLTEVEQGAQIVITRRGAAVARLVAAEPVAVAVASARAQRVASVFCVLDELSRGVTLDIPVREAIEQGRD